ncbi:MAG: trypsin-like peptidase domain-containing protein [Phycisphaerales bacterium]|nr:trypsin-like peptidase domain-containing protein [Phycisphaerales bacterium]
MRCLICNNNCRRLSMIAGSIILAGIVHPPAAMGGEDTMHDVRRVTPVVTVFRDASPAVVNLSTTKIVTVQSPFGMSSLFDEVFDFPALRRPMRYKTQSVGSGFLIHRDGYLVTNAHVVDRAAECKVTFADGTELVAEEVAIDRRNDLAVLKVNARKSLPYLKLGQSGDLMPGESVIAIGNPLGYQHTVTTGVISALNRELVFDEEHSYTGLIQTDASINPGNSGGPLLNVLGDLIGINTAIRGDAQNIGFAIPVNRLHDLLPVMLDIERLRRVEFGIHFDSGVRDNGRPGVRVKQVDPGTAAARANVNAGDVLIAIDNQPTPDFMQAFSLLERTPAGQSLKLDLVDPQGKQKSVEVLLADIPRQDAAKLMNRYFGVKVREMNRTDLRQLGLSRNVGLIVTSVERGSDASDAGIKRSDVIRKFGGWPVPTLDRLGHLIEQVERDDRIPFQVLRIGDRSYVRDLVLKAR